MLNGLKLPTFTSIIAVHMDWKQIWPMGQTTKQAPQLVGSERTSCSQPLPWLLSQSPKPGLQTNEQAPLTQAATAFWPLPMHALPQTPQLLMSVPSLTSHPFCALLSQSA